MTPLIVTLGLILFMAGIALTLAALRGRLLNTHPHCRSCGFDLIGLDIDRPARCPECGRPVRLGTASIRIGKRKRRRMLLAAGLLMLLVGATGLAWPKIAQIPSIKNFDWYAHFPEPLLLRLDAGGNKDALAELHSRLIPATLSEEGLQKLIDRSLTMMDDESVAWDERWGDVLLYAFMQHRMNSEQVVAYASRAIKLDLRFKDQFTTDRAMFSFMRGCDRVDRGGSSHQFVARLASGGNSPFNASQLNTGYALEVKKAVLLCDQIPFFEDDHVNLSGGIGDDHWIPFMSFIYGSTGQGAMLEAASQGKQTIELQYHFMLKGSDGAVHEWISSVQKPIMRMANPKHADFVSDPQVITEQLGDIKISELYLPSDFEAIGRSEEANTYRGIFEVYNTTQPPLGLCGEVWFQSGDERIKYGTNWFRADQHSGMGSHSVQGFPNRWWMYFIEHRDFWDRVRESGRVDVLILPDASLPKHHYDMTSKDRISGLPVIFRDVPVRFYQAISDAPWYRDSIRSQAMSGRNEVVGVVSPELLEVHDED